MGAVGAFLADGFVRFIFSRPHRASGARRLEQFSINNYRLRSHDGGQCENRKRVAADNKSGENRSANLK